MFNFGISFVAGLLLAALILIIIATGIILNRINQEEKETSWHSDCDGCDECYADPTQTAGYKENLMGEY